MDQTAAATEFLWWNEWLRSDIHLRRETAIAGPDNDEGLEEGEDEEDGEEI